MPKKPIPSESIRFFRKFEGREFIEGQDYLVGWIGWDSRHLIPCTFQKVTDKGYAFVRKDDETRFREKPIYPSDYWEERFVKSCSKAHWFNVHKQMVTKPIL